MKISARHVDTCLPCYLQDGYNRPGESLLLASLGGSVDSTVEELVQSADPDQIPSVISEEDIEGAVREALAGVDLRYIDPEGNPQDETPEWEDRDEEPYLYVVLEWDEEAALKAAEALSKGFSAGNFASAYRTENLTLALAIVDGEVEGDDDYDGVNPYGDASWPESLAAGYRAAFILGFCGSYTLREIPGSWRDPFDEAYHSVWGRRVLSLGYADSRDADYRKEYE